MIKNLKLQLESLPFPVGGIVSVWRTSLIGTVVSSIWRSILKDERGDERPGEYGTVLVESSHDNDKYNHTSTIRGELTQRLTPVSVQTSHSHCSCGYCFQNIRDHFCGLCMQLLSFDLYLLSAHSTWCSSCKDCKARLDSVTQRKGFTPSRRFHGDLI